MRLTDITVRNLKPPEKGSKIYYDDTLKGFGVRVTAATKAFILATGKNRNRTTIGRYPLISLQDARREAQKLIGDRAAGRHRPKRVTFGNALAQFIDTRKQKNRPSTVKETERLLRSYFKSLQPRQLEDIQAHHITDATDKLSKAGLQRSAASAHTAAHTFLKFCAQRGYISFNPIAEMEKPALPRSRDRVLSDDELRAVWQAAETTGGNFGKIVQLLILTGQRRSEVGNLRSEWLDLDKQIWTTPSGYSKNKRSHTFPMGELSLAVLQSSNFGTCSNARVLFPARGSDVKPFNGWSKAKAQLDKKIIEFSAKQDKLDITPWTLHDLRRTYATNLQKLGVKLEVIEALLNHVSGTRAGIVGVYNRHRYEAEMREAVEFFDSWFRRTIIQP